VGRGFAALYGGLISILYDAQRTFFGHNLIHGMIGGLANIDLV
jgi:hypothetical protein